jgi:DNA-binding IclR family transcriptional regulator
VQRLIGTLLEFGYIERAADTQKYRIGYRAFQVARSYLAQNDLHTASLPELRDLAERHHVNAYLGVLRDHTVVYLEALQSRGPIAIISTPGSQAHLHSTAFGKVLLAELQDAEAVAMLGPEPLLKLTAKTKTRLRPLLKELHEVRRLGYAVSDEENLDNVFAVGAVVRDVSGKAVAAISGAVPRNKMNRMDVDNLCRLITAAAERISRRLGASPRIGQSTSDKRSRAGKTEAPC